MRAVTITSAISLVGMVSLSAMSCGLELGGSIATYCPEGMTYIECKVKYGCGCGPGAPGNRDVSVGLCAPGGDDGAIAEITKRLKRMENVNSIGEIKCTDTGSNVIPSGASRLKPLNWGDNKCNQCVASKCVEDFDKCGNDELCVCMSQCQTAYPETMGQLTATDCGCTPADSTVYQDLVGCVQSHCVESCWPSESQTCENSCDLK